MAPKIDSRAEEIVATNGGFGAHFSCASFVLVAQEANEVKFFSGDENVAIPSNFDLSISNKIFEVLIR